MKRVALLSVALITFMANQSSFAKRLDSDFFSTPEEKREQRRIERKLKKRAEKITWSANYQDLLNENSRLFKRLFERHEQGRIIGLELIIASSSWSNIESGFGHTMLRFVDDVGPQSDDVVLSFVANIDSAKLNYFKGIFGGYPVFPQVKSLRLFMNEYNNNQKRDLDRYIILSNKQLRDQVINQLKEQWKMVTEHRIQTQRGVMQDALNDLKKYSSDKYGNGNYGILPLRSSTGSIYALSPVPNKIEGSFRTTVEEIFPVKYELPENDDLGDYTFFANNCAGALVNFLKQVGFPYRRRLGFKGRIPLALPKYLQRALSNPYPIIKIKSLRNLKEKVVEILDLKDEEYLQYDINKDQTAKLLKSLSLNETRKLNEIVSFNLEAFNYYAQRIEETKRISFDELHGLKSVPKSLYEICNNSACEEEVIESLNSFYGAGTYDEVKKISQKQSEKSIMRWKRDHDTKRRIRVYRKPYRGLLVNKEILDHYKRLNLLHEKW